MTTANPSIVAWAEHPAGKVARIAIASGGLITATLVLMTASVVATGSWALVFLGVSLAALAVRAARIPTMVRLFLTAAALIGILLTYQAL
ncbi:MAG TPA: hypothetical protein VF148_00350 [Acidimicrobiia bacterium]